MGESRTAKLVKIAIVVGFMVYATLVCALTLVIMVAVLTV